MMNDNVAQAIRDAFISPNVCDSNLEPANLVDVFDRIACSLKRIADSLESVVDSAASHNLFHRNRITDG